MLKEIIKRDGTTEPFVPAKINRWSIWASEQLGDRVDWSGVVMETMAYFKDQATSQDLQRQLIKCCVQRKSWPYSLMAGRLYAALTRKELYGQIEPPSIKELHTKLQEAGMMMTLNYTDEQYEVLNEFIDHKRDFEMAYTQLLQLRKKYALRNHNTKEEYESAQFVFMRMAMRLAMNESEDRKVAEAVNFYNNLSLGRVNAPTPNYVNLGTKHNGYASCAVYKSDDSIDSLAIGDHIAYKMTAMSAGLGNHISTRTLNDSIRNGLISHQGKLPYYRSMAFATLANKQGSRGGALTSYYTCYDPENYTIAQLQNPLSTEDKKIRQIHFGVMFNKFFAEKVAKNEEVFTFTEWSAPDLYQAMFKGDDTEFRELYEKYEQDSLFPKNYFNARDFAILCRQQSYETGTHYALWIDEMNRHTPFKDPIYSSNLCVTGDTRILTNEGYFPIQELAGTTVKVWNGKKFSASRVEQTGQHQPIITVTTSEGAKLNCTPYHKFYIFNGFGREPKEVRASELKAGDKLVNYELPKAIGGELKLVDLPNGVTNVPFANYSIAAKIKYLTSLTPISIGPGIVFNNFESYTHAHDVYLLLQTLSIRSRIKKMDNEVTLQCDYNIIVEGKWANALIEMNLGVKGYNRGNKYTSKNDSQPVKVMSVVDNGEFADTYCFNEPNRHMGVFGGILTGNCSEIALPTKGYSSMTDLYSSGNHNGEVAICALAAIVIPNIKDDAQYEQAVYYALKMVDNCIDMSDYPFEQVGYTARARRSAGVGIIGLATELARKGLKYDTQAGRDYCHFLAERHYYWLVKASLRLAKERGNAPWINKTKWVDGWLPIDTYNKNVDSITPPNYKYDWETLRAEIKAQGGIRNSVLAAQAPTESSSKATGMPNAIYPIRDVSIKKTDNNNSIDWVATDSDLLGNLYQSAWEIDTIDMLKVYAIFQKFMDQGISADLWKDRVKDPEVYSDEIIREHLTMAKYGVKGHYYQNSLTSKQDYDTRFDFGESKLKVPEYTYSNTVNISPTPVKNTEATNVMAQEPKQEIAAEDDSIFEYSEDGGRGCASGACTL